MENVFTLDKRFTAILSIMSNDVYCSIYTYIMLRTS